MSGADWQLSVLSRDLLVDWQLLIGTRGYLPLVRLADWYKGVGPLVRLIGDRSTAQWPMVIEQEEGELQKASEVTRKVKGRRELFSRALWKLQVLD